MTADQAAQAEKFIACLPGKVVKRSPSDCGLPRWRVQCPAHDDRNPSLMVEAAENGSVLLDCRANCATENVVAAVGWTMSDLFPPQSRRSRGTVARVHQYVSADGEIVAEHVKLSGSGAVVWRQPAVGGHIWNIKGVDLPLYRLPEMLSRPGESVFICEGEKDADTMLAAGHLATTAGNGWKKVDASALGGRTSLVIVIDNDATGWRKGRAVRDAVNALGCPVDALRPPDSFAGVKVNDLSDLFTAGGDEGDLLDIDLDHDEPVADGGHLYAKHNLSIVRDLTKCCGGDGFAMWVEFDARALDSGVAHLTPKEVGRNLGLSRHDMQTARDALVANGWLRELRRGHRWQVHNPLRPSPALPTSQPNPLSTSPIGSNEYPDECTTGGTQAIASVHDGGHSRRNPSVHYGGHSSDEAGPFDGDPGVGRPAPARVVER